MEGDDYEGCTHCPECDGHRIEDAYGGEALRCMDCDHVFGYDFGDDGE